MARFNLINTPKRAILRWRHDRLMRRHAGEMLRPEEVDFASVRRALVILPNWRMGNLLLATPICQWLREGLQARGAKDPVIDLCSGDSFASLLIHHPHVRRHIAIPTAFHPFARRAMHRSLAAEGYDLAFLANYGGDHLGCKIAVATGARYRLGAGSGNEGPLNVIVKRPGKDDPITEQHRAVLERLGLEPDPSVDLTMVSTPEELEEARREIASWSLGEGRRPVGLFPCGHRIKQIPLGHWARIIERLRQDFPDLEPVVFHAPADRGKIEVLQRTLGTRPVRAVSAPLRRFCALVECMEAIISCDAGPLHLARAKRRPLVSLFTKPNHDKFAPTGPGRICLFDPAGPSPQEVSSALRRVRTEVPEP
ncbi:glycosyltransferase family 9 protein [Candidatus Sumerlaeota bacterium]|nr:glycosyltransferase family 9 protein [Candidatus Sumerlaeota bacterium]